MRSTIIQDPATRSACPIMLILNHYAPEQHAKHNNSGSGEYLLGHNNSLANTTNII